MADRFRARPAGGNYLRTITRTIEEVEVSRAEGTVYVAMRRPPDPPGEHRPQPMVELRLTAMTAAKMASMLMKYAAEAIEERG